MKKRTKQIKEMLSAGVTTGVGSLALTKMGSTSGASAMNKYASFYPTIATVQGGSWTLKELKKLK